LAFVSKTLTLVITFDCWVVELLYFMCIPSGKTFHLMPWNWPTDIWPLFENFNFGHKHMQNTFFECSASLKFLMRQKTQCQFWNVWQGPFWLSQSSSLFNVDIILFYHLCFMVVNDVL
jgi:hypothetical protein